MQVSKIQLHYLPLSSAYSKNDRRNINSGEQPVQKTSVSSPFKQIPLSYKYNANVVSFGEFFDPNRTVPHIDYEEYMAMSEATKKRMRKRYQTFYKDSLINTNELFDNENYRYMPLNTENKMDKFIEFSKIYLKYKDQPIISLGRSPKWFLNTALWMKDGIDDYKFVAFSKYWYKKDRVEGLKQIPEMMPTEKEEEAYKKYLKRIKADPQSIVDNMRKTGKKTVITDYIHTGRGFGSFLDLLSKYAEELGILEEFSKSIQLVCIGSLEYEESLDQYAETVDTPYVVYPERLRPYKNNIKQEFYSMPAEILEEMLINQNTNECRSTYYPHESWTVYKPDQFKTGLITDMKKVKQKIKELKKSGKKSMSSFTPAMYDYRNLLNFRILDGLDKRGLLKDKHKSKF